MDAFKIKTDKNCKFCLALTTSKLELNLSQQSTRLSWSSESSDGISEFPDGKINSALIKSIGHRSSSSSSSKNSVQFSTAMSIASGSISIPQTYSAPTKTDPIDKMPQPLPKSQTDPP